MAHFLICNYYTKVLQSEVDMLRISDRRFITQSLINFLPVILLGLVIFSLHSALGSAAH